MYPEYMLGCTADTCMHVFPEHAGMYRRYMPAYIYTTCLHLTGEVDRYAGGGVGGKPAGEQ